MYDCESESLETRFQSSDVKNNIIHSISFSPWRHCDNNDDGSVSLRDVAMHPKTGVFYIPNPNKRWMDSSSITVPFSMHQRHVSWHLGTGWPSVEAAASWCTVSKREESHGRENSKNRNIR